jgi:hypothetical protein
MQQLPYMCTVPTRWVELKLVTSQQQREYANCCSSGQQCTQGAQSRSIYLTK